MNPGRIISVPAMLVMMSASGCSAPAGERADGGLDALTARDVGTDASSSDDGGPIGPADGSLDWGIDAQHVSDDVGSDAPADAGVDAPPPSLDGCVPLVVESWDPGTCDEFGRMDCQRQAEMLAPGWDVATDCVLGRHPACVRGTGCAAAMLLPDGGQYFPCACGTGPACDPGYECARPIGHPELPYSCVCAPGP